MLPILGYLTSAACRVPWRAATCPISCAITPAISASLSAFSRIPVFTKKKPPGSAKALISSESSDLNGEQHFQRRVARQVLANPVHVLGNDRIVDNLGLALDLLGPPLQLRPRADLFLDR